MTLAENHRPDSALSLLQTLNRSRFSEAEAAHYALVYTLSQDKSGIDVSNDSLLRLASQSLPHCPPTASTAAACTTWANTICSPTVRCCRPLSASKPNVPQLPVATQLCNVWPSKTINPLTLVCPHQSLQYIDKALSLYAAYSASHLYQSHSPAACQKAKIWFTTDVARKHPFGRAPCCPACCNKAIQP